MQKKRALLGGFIALSVQLRQIVARLHLEMFTRSFSEDILTDTGC